MESRIYKQKYRKEWEKNPILSDWIRPTGDFEKASCFYCGCLIAARYSDLIRHSETTKHKEKIAPFIKSETVKQETSTFDKTEDNSSKDAQNTSKRRRKSAGHRWSQEEVEALLLQICQVLKNDANSLERPTAQTFYQKVAAGQEILTDIHWTIMKSKMRYLEKLYMSARKWKNKADAGQMDKKKEKLVSDYINKICPHFDALEEIYATRKQYKFSSSDSDSAENSFVKAEDISNIDPLDVCNEADFFEASSFSGQLSNESLAGKNRRFKEQNASVPLCELIKLQEKKLELENEKFEWEKKKDESLMELKKIELKQQLELKKMELEKDERIEMLKLESQEKMKKYEIELKYKTK